MWKDTKAVACAITQAKINLIKIAFILGVFAICAFIIYTANSYANELNSLNAYMNAFNNTIYSTCYA